MEWRYKEWIKCPDCKSRAKIGSLGSDRIHFGYKCDCGFEKRLAAEHLVFGDGNNLEIIKD